MSSKLFIDLEKTLLNQKLFRDLGVVTHAYNSRTWEVETGESEVQDYS